MNKDQIILVDSDNSMLSDPIKKRATDVLVRSFDSAIITNVNANPNNCVKFANVIKNTNSIVVIWNNLKPFSIYAIDLCSRFDSDYVIIERGIVPSQGDDNYAFYANGICFDNTNISPENFDPNTYDKNVETIKNYYHSRNLHRKEPVEKIVFVGQLLFDSTITHYTRIDSYDTFIDSYIKEKSIDTNKTEIVYCPHPRMSGVKSKYKISKKKTIEECLDAKYAVAISSTLIYELVGLNIPVKITGKGPYKFPTERGWNEILKCHSTALDFHFNSQTEPEQIKTIIEKTINITRATKK
jgi:hypothetical protein